MERRDLETVRYEMAWDVENCLKDAEADYDVKVVLLKAAGSMRVHLQSQFHIMWQVAAAGDVAAWQKENIEHGYGPLPRRVAAQRAEAAARRAASRTARDGADS
jgi:hypothetical protein